MNDEQAAPGGPKPMNDSAVSIKYRVHLAAGRERSVLRRHPWIYSGAIDLLEGRDDAEPGDVGEVVSAAGEKLGLGMVNPDARLVVRMLRFDDGQIDAIWLRESLARAAALRRDVVPPQTDAYRLVNAEGDGLPGLIVDCYADWLCVQCLTAGMDRLEPLWLPALRDLVEPRGILERRASSRHESGLARSDRLLWGEEPPAVITISEGAAHFNVDLLHGQKTGFYLDQRENRAIVAELARERTALDAFAYTGAFAVRMGLGGARQVTAVDSSAAALHAARDNWVLNALPAERFTPVRANVADFLRSEPGRFDLIVLDPPPFAREHAHVGRAARAYKDVNIQALRHLSPGGWLATFSCSQHIGADLFQKIVFAAALDAGVSLAWVRKLGAAPDHPVHLYHPQGEYLTGLLLRSLG